jgi:hypothetical protein
MFTAKQAMISDGRNSFPAGFFSAAVASSLMV